MVQRVFERVHDAVVILWYRYVYCVQHGHYKTAYTGDVQRCLNCAKRIKDKP